MDPSQLQTTVWFYILCFFDKRGHESQCQLEQWMLVLKRTPIEREYYEVNMVVLRAIPMNKNHQGGLKDNEDKSDEKIVTFPNSSIKTLKNYLSHLNSHLVAQSLSQAKTSALV